MRRIKHCRACGNPVGYQVPDDDNRERAVCPACGLIHYENPLNVVGTVPVWGEQVLLCKRAIEPRHGFWTLPAGFMELGETVEDGARRETVEEAGANIEQPCRTGGSARQILSAAVARGDVEAKAALAVLDGGAARR